MKAIDLSRVEAAQEHRRLPAGGYVCGITRVEDVSEREYLRMEFDIAEGEYKNYYRQLQEKHGFWGGKLYKSYKEKALPFFKAFTTAVERSNAGYVWDNNEQSLKRKLVGLVLGEEEYRKNDGSVGVRLYVAKEIEADRIRCGNYEVPLCKQLPEPVAPVSMPLVVMQPEELLDDELPF